jgi:hypothetical protein
VARRELTFTKEERARLAEVCIALGTTFEEFAHFATMRCIDECEGYANDAALIHAYYEGNLDAHVGTFRPTMVRPFEVGPLDYESPS